MENVINELVKLWVRPEYLPMLTMIAVTVKLAVVPIVKALLSKTHPLGYTSVGIATIGSVLLSFVYKVAFPVGTWSLQDIVMTVIVGVLAAMTSIGMNVLSQALQQNDVNVIKV